MGHFASLEADHVLNSGNYKWALGWQKKNDSVRDLESGRLSPAMGVRAE